MGRATAASEGAAAPAVQDAAPGRTGAHRSAPPSGGATFEVIDAGDHVGMPAWVHAGDRSAEAGFQDPAVGWIGVRANFNGGSVHAALVPGSADAAQVLSAHLPGLSAHLSEEHVPVASLTMESAAGNGLTASTDQGAQHNGQKKEPPDGAVIAASHLSSESGAGFDRAQSGPGTETGDIVWPPRMDAGRGSRISVMA